MFFREIMSRDNDELIKKVYSVMKLKPVRHDWSEMIRDEKNKYGIVLSDEEIGAMSKNKFKAIVNNSVTKFAYKSLLTKAKTQSKCLNIVDSLNEDSWKIQRYLTCESMTKEEQQLCFILRSRSFLVKTNYKSQFENDMTCRGCHDPTSVENEIHVVSECLFLKDERN